MTTVLQLVRSAMAEMGLTLPTSLAGSNNTDAIQLLALANKVGGELQRKYTWQALSIEYRFTTEYESLTGTLTSGSAVVTGISDTTGLDATYMVIGTGLNTDTYVQTVDSGTQVTLNQAATASGTVTLAFCKTKYTMPSDYDRSTDQTQWDKTHHWQILGPCTAQQWQWFKSGYIATGPRIHWRRLGDYFQIWPALSAAEYLGMEYTSKNWAMSAAGVGKSSFTVDTDTCIYPDRLMIDGIKVSYQKAKGLGDEYVADYAEQLAIAQGADLGAETLSLSPTLDSTLIGWQNIPDSGYGR